MVAGLPVDLLVERNGRSLGIDLVGYPGEFSKAFELEKYRLFQRAGLPLFPLSLRAWRNQRHACLQAIEHWTTQGSPAVTKTPEPIKLQRPPGAIPHTARTESGGLAPGRHRFPNASTGRISVRRHG